MSTVGLDYATMLLASEIYGIKRLVSLKKLSHRNVLFGIKLIATHGKKVFLTKNRKRPR